jgi:DHA1 family multidrug resistance protein-like MFS transporter
VSGLPSWRRNQYVTGAMVFVVFLAFAFVLPFMPLYVRELGVEDEEQAALWAGVLIGIAPLLAGLMAPVWGRLAERHGHKRMALRALATYVVLLALSAHVGSPWQLLVLRASVGLFGGIGPLGLAMATSLAPREETGRAVGLVQSAQILSAAIGPFVGGLLADWIGIRATFWITASLCGVALLLVARFYEEAPRTADAAKVSAHTSFREVLKLPRIAWLLLVLFLVNFIGRSFTPILPLQLGRLGLPPERLALATGLLISLYSVAAAASSTALGRLSKSRAPSVLLTASLVGGALTVLPMAFAPGFLAFLALAVLLGLSAGGALTLCYTIGGLSVPAERRSTAFGFFSGAALFGGSISPTVAGLIAHVDLRGIYYVDAALYLALALGMLFYREAPAPPAPSA